jgi:hypothetical protein
MDVNGQLSSCCRRGRVTILEKDAMAQHTEEALKKKELEAEERRKQSHDLVAESIRRELAESRPNSVRTIVSYLLFYMQRRRKTLFQTLMILMAWILRLNSRPGDYGSWDVSNRRRKKNPDERKSARK